MNTDDKRTETATFGGGCFWCMEAVFSRHEGVEEVTSGYAGGTTEGPSYEDVCTGTTGHAEVIQVTYDPDVLRYEDLLDIFWRAHDPTTLNRQGADVGTQYRSIILYHNENQRKAAERSRQALDESGAYRDAIVTEIQPFDAFYPAEEYHQDYFQKHPYAGYCTFVIRPKLKKLNLLH
ncbi:MAG: peptide-methionine (S)-S-oxide reductase MsrA [Spirochaetota bacterium]|nr:peptide-methionine (S)-S-oxide reductase MsrA [Spirochaetota bacterium]